MAKVVKDREAFQAEIKNFGDWLNGNKDLIDSVMLNCMDGCESCSGDFIYYDKQLDRERGELCRQGYYYDFCGYCHRELKGIYERQKVQDVERAKDWEQIVKVHNEYSG